MPLGEMSNTQETEEKDARLKQYKNLGKHEELRRRRTECSVEIRKQKNENLLMKRRNLQEDDNDEGEVSEVSDVEGKQVTISSKLTIPQIIEILTKNPTIPQMRSCFEAIRRMLSKSQSPPVDAVISSGLLQALVQALAVEDEKIRFEAAWGLTNIVSGTSDQTIAAVNAGACKPLIELCITSSESLSEQALWAMANIVGDSAQLRDYTVQYGFVQVLLELTNHLDQMSDAFARTLAWSYSNMCRHKNPHASLEVLKALSVGLNKLITHKDKQVRQDTCWAVSYLTDGPDEQINLACECGVLQKVIGFLREKTDALVAPALRVLGNLATGDDDLTQAVIDLGTLNELIPLAERSRSVTVVKECCWLVSNVIAGTQSQIQAVIDAGLIPVLIEVLKNGEFRCQYEASWAIANLTQGGTSEQIYTLFLEKAVPVLCGSLIHDNVDMLTNSLESIYIILNTVAAIHPEKIDELKDSIEECGGLELLERVQDNRSEKVYQQAYRIVTEYFNDDDDYELDDSEELVELNDENKNLFNF